MTESTRGTSSLRAVLAQASFTRFLAGRFMTSMAVQMQTVAVGLQVYRLTHDPLDLGLVGLSQFLPFLLCVLPAGQLADRFRRKRIVVGCFVIQWLCAVSLLALTHFAVTRTWPIFVVMSFFGAARAAVMPASQALTPNLVPKHLFGNAIAINSSMWQVATIIGPALGGLVYASAGPLVVYEVVVVLLTAGLLAVLGMRSPPQPPPQGQATVKHLMEGVRFVFTRPLLLGVTSLDLFAVMFGGATALLPAYATDVLDIGPQGLGWLRSAPGCGAALMASLIAVRPIGRRVGLTLFASIAVFGIATIVFGMSRQFSVSMAALAVLGAADMVSVYVRQLLVQLDTPDAMRGRVGAVNSMFIGASNELGEFESGITAAWWGLVPAVVVGGVATILIAGLWSRLFPMIRRMDRFPRP
jgi:MFS family permease